MKVFAFIALPSAPEPPALQTRSVRPVFHPENLRYGMVKVTDIVNFTPIKQDDA